MKKMLLFCMLLSTSMMLLMACGAPELGHDAKSLGTTENDEPVVITQEEFLKKQCEERETSASDEGKCIAFCNGKAVRKCFYAWVHELYRCELQAFCA